MDLLRGYYPATSRCPRKRVNSNPDLGAKTATTKFEYTDAANPGMVTKVIPPRGNPTDTPDYTYATTLVYNGTGTQAGMLASSTDALGNKVTYTYDAVGRRLSSVDQIGNAAGGTPANHRTDWVYDGEDRQTFVKLPAPAAGGAQLVSESRYDLGGNRTVAIDANGQVTKFLYDARNRLSEVQESPSVWTDPALTPSPLFRTAYAYDDLGNLSRITRAVGDAASERVLDMAYDGAGRQRSETQYPAWPATTPTLVNQYAYDGNGNRITLTDPLARTTTFGFDALNRVTSTAFSDGSTPNTSVALDANGNRTQMTDGTGTTSYTYDELDRLLTVTTPGPKTVTYRYDEDGNRRKLIYPDGTAVNYTIDKGQRTTALAESTRTTTYAYREDGTVRTVTLPNGTTASYSYDNARRLASLANASSTQTFSSHRYTLDAVGNRTRVDEALAQVGAPPAQSWGDDISGQLGDSTAFADKTSPVAISGLATPAALAGGRLHSLALMADGTMRAWGENVDGQVGDDTSTDRTTPVSVLNITTAAAIAAGGDHSLAVLRDGTARSWGRNTNGQLGDGTTTLKRTPVTVSGLSGVAVVSGGTAHSLAAKSDGSAWSWGLRTNGRLGDGSSSGNQTTPVQVTALASVTAVAAGGAHSLALKSDGTVWAWGLNASGQLGDNTTSQRLTAVQVKDPAGTGFLSGVSAIAAGDNHSLALKSDGTLFAWGSNVIGQRGDNTSGSANNRKLPVQVKGPGGAGFLTTVSSIEAGASHSVAAKQDGTAWAWGLGTDGRLGNGSTAQQNAPVQSGTLTFVTQLAAGGGHSLARTTLTPVFAYGYDRLYRLSAENATTYAYDPVGNRSAMGATTYSYDRADRITAAGAVAYTVNDAGNLTGRGADSFAYDQANRLKTATVSGTTTTYAYDGDGLRASRTVNAQTTSFVYDRAAKLPVILDDGTRRFIWGPAGLAYSLEGATASVFHADALRSIRALSDAAGALTQRYSRDAWGNPTAAQGSSAQPFGFTGELNDSGTGLLYLRARDYDPATGRFMQRDTYGGAPAVPVSLHRFVYAADNPLSYRDPTGKWCVGATLGGIATFGLLGVGGMAGLANVGMTVCGGGPAGVNIAAVGNVGGFFGPITAPSATSTATGNFASGAYAGAGVSFFVSPQATTASDLSGPFNTASFDAGVGAVGIGLEHSTGSTSDGRAVEVFGLTPPLLSGGVGLAFTVMETATMTVPLWSETGGWLDPGLASPEALPTDPAGGGDIFLTM